MCECVSGGVCSDGIIRQHLACMCVCVYVCKYACVFCMCVCDPPQMERAPYSSRVAAVLAPCLVGLAIVVMLALALAVAKLRERRQTEGGFTPRQLEAPGGRFPPAELGHASISTLAARVERLV